MADNADAIKFQSTKDGSMQTYALTTADEFYAKAREAIAAGDNDTAERMISAALALLGGKQHIVQEPQKRPDSEVAKVTSELRKGWTEPAQLSESLGIQNARIHAVLARIRSTRGIKLEKKTVNYYRIVD